MAAHPSAHILTAAESHSCVRWPMQASVLSAVASSQGHTCTGGAMCPRREVLASSWVLQTHSWIPLLVMKSLNHLTGTTHAWHQKHKINRRRFPIVVSCERQTVNKWPRKGSIAWPHRHHVTWAPKDTGCPGHGNVLCKGSISGSTRMSHTPQPVRINEVTFISECS